MVFVCKDLHLVSLYSHSQVLSLNDTQANVLSNKLAVTFAKFCC